MKRFAYVCADPGIPLPGRKGSSIHVASLCRAFVRRGLDGAVHAARARGTALAGLPLEPLPGRRRPAPRDAGRSEAALFLDQLGASPREVGAPPDFVYERYSLWHAAGLARARALGVPFVLEVNSPLPDEAERHRGLVHGELARGLARVLVGEADCVICVSDDVARWVLGLRGRERGVRVVPNGVDEELFRPEPGAPRPWPRPGVPLLAFAGSFRPWHGTEDLLEAFLALLGGPVPDAHLLLVGDGPTRPALEERVRREGLERRVRFTGAVAHEEVPVWLRGADVAVAPYPAGQRFYFSPLKVFEFLALGVPIVAAGVGQLRLLVPHGRRGWLYAPGSVDELVAALTRSLTRRDEARRMAREGLAWVLRHATWSRRAEEILTHVRTVAPGRTQEAS